MNTYKTPIQDNPMKLHSVYNIIRIIMPKSLEGEQETVIEAIKSALPIFHTKSIRVGVCVDNQNTFDIGKIAKPFIKEL